jgi:hypothetical protein
VTLTNGYDVSLQRISAHCRHRLEAVLKVYSMANFARKYGVCDSRVRQLLLEGRIFPHQKLGNGRWIMFGNSVVMAPYDRANRKLREAK